ncbi:histidinol dehydrogenase [bacterium]|nr:histidinol dehydrogenase [bacterium]
MIALYQNTQIDEFLSVFENRRQDIPQEVRDSVRVILQAVREKGDDALFELTGQFDHVDVRPLGLRVTGEEIESAVRDMPAGFLDILEESAANIRRYHERCRMQSWKKREKDGVILGQRVTPLDRVGIYVPGGRAAYPSSLIMAAVPAQVAGVGSISVVSPPAGSGQIHAPILATAGILGISDIYRVGGAQAVAALAYGTDSVQKVDKIVGPGNIFVAEGKRQVYGLVDIDMIAGPSEVVVLADDSADPGYVAADLLAQAEHDPLASAICVTHDSSLAERVQQAVVRQADSLKRQEILKKSLGDWSGILIAESWDKAVELTNRLAAEHLGLHVRDPWETLAQIRHAGAIFLGHFAPETVGDYWAGPNHVLPTNQTARFASPLGTSDFQKVSSLIQYSKKALKKHAEKIMTFANMEGFDGHANAVRQRID